MTARLLLLIFGGVVAFSAPTADANILYLSPTGSDSNLCAADSPCLTVARAESLAVPGDTVEFAQGVYRTPVTRIELTKSGTATSPITYRGHDGAGCPAASLELTRGGLTVQNDPHHPTGTRPAPAASTDRWVINANFVTIECFSILQSSSNDAFYIKGTDRAGITIANNRVDGATSPCRYGVFGDNAHTGHYATGVIVRGNYFNKCDIGINAVWNASRVELNEIASPTGGTRDYTRAGGDGVTMRRNYMYGANLDGCPSCHIDCVQQFILATDPDHVFKNFVFAENTCFNFHQGILTQDESTGVKTYTGRLQNATIVNNVFAHGVQSDDPHEMAAMCVGVASMKNVVVYHNTCINALNGISVNAGSTGSVRNNLIVATLSPLGTDSISQVVMASNWFWSPQCETDVVDEDADPSGPSCGRVYSSQVAGGTGNIDPIFTNLAALDLTLQQSSPARNAGVDVGVTIDRFGASRVDGRPDIGAFEISAAVPPSNLRLSH